MRGPDIEGRKEEEGEEQKEEKERGETLQYGNMGERRIDKRRSF